MSLLFPYLIVALLVLSLGVPKSAAASFKSKERAAASLQSVTASISCDSTCSTCNGPTANDCLTCPANFMFQPQNCTFTGYIQANKSSDGSFFSYIYMDCNFIAGCHEETSDENQALLVSFNTASGSPFDLKELNGVGAANNSFLGACSNFGNTNDNLGPGSFNSALLTDTSQTPPNSSAQIGHNSLGNQLKIESAIWSFDSSTNQLIPQWVNSDGFKLQTVLVYNTNSNAFFITGDQAAFDEYGTTVQVNFYFVQVSQECSVSCSSCNPGFFLTQDHQCLGTCPAGYFGDTGTNTCIQCYQSQSGSPLLSCATCSSAGDSACLSCNSGSFLYQGECLGTCPAGYFGDTGTNTCIQCYQSQSGSPLLSCATCNAAGDSACLSCNSGSFLYQGECLGTCPAGYFGDMGTNTCIQCYQSQSGSPLLSCATCSSAGDSACLSCNSGSFLYQGECIGICPAGYFGDTGTNTCIQCYQSQSGSPLLSCATCNAAGDSACLSCNSGSFLYQGECLGTCPAGYFGDTGTNTCIQCYQSQSGSPLLSCATCNAAGDSACLSCNSGSFLYQGECLGTCPAGYFGDTGTNTCIQCYQSQSGAPLFSCATCSSAGDSACLSCNSGSFLYQGECLGTCPAGYFGDTKTNTCTHCYQSQSGAPLFSCATCSSAGDSACLSCNSGSFLYQGECLGTCPAGYFGDTKTNTCTHCYQSQSGSPLLSCATCNAAGDSACLSCNSGSFLYQGECLGTCPAGYFGDTKTNTCTHCYQSSSTCPYTCATCNAAGSSACLSCNSGSFLYQGQCVLQCPVGYYKNTNANTCTRCTQTLTFSFICISCTSNSSSACQLYGTTSLLSSDQKLYPVQVCSKTSNNPYSPF